MWRYWDISQKRFVELLYDLQQVTKTARVDNRLNDGSEKKKK